jgi:YHS domain-containing protein
MTSARPQRKSRLAGMASGLPGCLVVPAFALVFALVLPLSSLPPAAAATTERVVSDPHTGLAISGVDPVAYFTDAAPLLGRADYEYRYAGVVWRFRNEGNAAAFVANPDVYMPRYGGYDAVAIGRTVAVPGNPLLWAVVGERLYLFYSEAARAHFVANPEEAILLAENKWPAVLSVLVP